jgi:hypothetical protein
MKQVQIKRTKPRRPAPADLDKSSPSGKTEHKN